MTYFEAFLLAVIEGITEYLPVSSTGHIIIGSSLMGIAEQSFTKLFTIAVQFGAILSVVVLYWKRFFRSADFYFKLFAGFIPAAVLGKLFGDQLDLLLENVVVVAFSLVIGGIILLFLDKWFERNESSQQSTDVNYSQAILIGCFQCIALIPGVSRSAATIVGGLSQKLNRKTAAEFSFFLAVPTLFAASAYKLYQFYKGGETLTGEQWTLLAFGNVVAFVVAMMAIRGFITYLSKNGFRLFGYYRIAVGLIILVLYYLGIPLSIV